MTERIRQGRPAPPSPFVSIGRLPRAGFYRTRLAKNGPFIAVRIWFDADRHEPGNPENKLDRSSIWQAEIDGLEIDIDTAWGPHMKLEIITCAECRFLIDDAAHAREYRPDDPEANPTKAVDIGSMVPIF